eukprot:TRINITY_DN2257_c0_g3_i1.p1 TRINITY_DN2257_c0_g3~~TRINITY_DN2257_c0_g3_i1.p1  ORF type:complete len:361 (+),score=48.10 TRINITY_DN2257_c0_g3_i1:50-1132(+)
MLQEQDFWKEETNAPILSSNNNYLPTNIDKITSLIETWPQHLFPEGLPEEISIRDDFKVKRIIEMDAIRTFSKKKHQDKLINVLSHIEEDFHDYHQALSYISGVLLMFFSPSRTIQMVKKLNYDPKYVPGYWKHEAIGFGTDAYVFYHLLGTFHPTVEKHLTYLRILPETYVQKWFAALCIHVLPYECLFEFLDRFFKEGHMYLFKFGLSLVEHLKDRLLKATSVHSIYELLRLDPKLEIKMDLIHSIVSEANKYDLSGFNIKELREEMYEKHLKNRVEKAHKLKEEVSSDDDDDDDESEEEQDGIQCGICEDNMPDYLCLNCKVLICGLCQQKQSHKAEHRLKPLDGLDIADELEKLHI